MNRAAGVIISGMLLLAVAQHAEAQLLVPIDSLSSTIAENFNGMSALSNAA